MIRFPAQLQGVTNKASVSQGGLRSVRESPSGRLRGQNRDEDSSGKIVTDEALNQLRKSLEQAAAGRTVQPIRSQDKRR